MNKILLSITLFLFLFSCNKNSDQLPVLSHELQVMSESVNPTQKFSIKPNIDTVLTGKQETHLFISANSFEYENGIEVSSEVTLTLKEVYSFSEMILNGLSTTTVDGGLLQTSGMIRVLAFANGEKLRLKEGSPIKIRFKKTVESPFMRTYLGVEDSTAIKWRLDKNNVFDTVKITWEKRPSTDLIYSDTTEYSENYGIIWQDTIELNQNVEPLNEDIFINTSLNFQDDISQDYTVEDSVANLIYYELHATQLNWINCDFFIGKDNLINTTVELPSKGIAYLVFKNYNAIMTSINHGVRKEFFNIPRGSEVTVLSILEDNGNYSIGTKHQILNSSDKIMNFKFESVSKEELTERIVELNDK